MIAVSNFLDGVSLLYVRSCYVVKTIVYTYYLQVREKWPLVLN